MGRPKGSKNRKTLEKEAKQTAKAAKAPAKTVKAPAKTVKAPSLLKGSETEADASLVYSVINNGDLSTLSPTQLQRVSELGRALQVLVADEANQRVAAYQDLTKLSAAVTVGLGGDARPVLPVGIERLDHTTDPRITLSSSKTAPNGAAETEAGEPAPQPEA